MSLLIRCRNVDKQKAHKYKWQLQKCRIRNVVAKIADKQNINDKKNVELSIIEYRVVTLGGWM